MTDADVVTLTIPPPGQLLALEIWGDLAAVEGRIGGALPGPGTAITRDGRRILWWEPRTWLIRGAALGGVPDTGGPAHAAGPEGAATDLSGGFVRHRLDGSGWRALLMIGGVFDAEAPAFSAGSTAGTVIQHIPVRLDVLTESTVEVYVPRSYAADLLHHWRTTGPQLTCA